MAKNNNGKKSPLQETVYRFCQNRVSLIGLVILIALILMMVLAPVIADPDLATKQNIPNRLKGPSAEHIFGTDGFGRDIFARVVHGAITQVEQSDGEFHTYTGVDVPKYLSDAGHNTREVTLTTAPLCMPNNENPFISAKVL